MVVIKDRKKRDFMLLTAISTDLKNGRTTCFWGPPAVDVFLLCINTKNEQSRLRLNSIPWLTHYFFEN